MAVQQNKKSPSKRGMHRAHQHLSVPGTAVEPTTLGTASVAARYRCLASRRTSPSRPLLRVIGRAAIS